jgi:hypothetical protein
MPLLAGLVTPSCPSACACSKLERPLTPPEGVEPTLLFSNNSRVNEYNQRKLQSLPGPGHSYTARDTGEQNELRSLQKNCLADFKLVRPLPSRWRVRGWHESMGIMSSEGGVDCALRLNVCVCVAPGAAGGRAGHAPQEPGRRGGPLQRLHRQGERLGRGSVC